MSTLQFCPKEHFSSQRTASWISYALALLQTVAFPSIFFLISSFIWDLPTDLTTEKVRMLQEDYQNALRQIDELKAKNRELEGKLLLVRVGKMDTVPAKCMVVGDSTVLSVGAEHADMMVQCFPGIKTDGSR